MGNMDSWDVTLLVVAGYLAIMSLVRLMARRRSQVFEELRQQAEKEKRIKKTKEDLLARRQRSA
jgi:hypothetical protein